MTAMINVAGFHASSREPFFVDLAQLLHAGLVKGCQLILS